MPVIPFAAAFEAIRVAAIQYDGDADGFAGHLREAQLPHLSFTSLASVEACPRRYQLEYVESFRLEPTPRYFVKGKAFHRMAQAYYQEIAGGGSPTPHGTAGLADELSDPLEQAHLRNAAELLHENAWRGWQVVAVETPFVIAVDPELPPCVGVIDLILRHNGTMAVIDHKTGSIFSPHDPLQMAIYRQYVRTQSPEATCRMAFDNYRWVAHLGRIRKPAFWREEVPAALAGWGPAVERLKAGYARMRQITATGWAPRLGACFRCPYRGKC